jgi:hypothetical protein
MPTSGLTSSAALLRAGTSPPLTKPCGRASAAAISSMRDCARGRARHGTSSPTNQPRVATCATTWTSTSSSPSRATRAANDGHAVGRACAKTQRPFLHGGQARERPRHKATSLQRACSARKSFIAPSNFCSAFPGRHDCVLCSSGDKAKPGGGGTASQMQRSHVRFLC